MTAMESRSPIFAIVLAPLLTLGLAAGLTGCATQKKVWHKPGLTQDQWAVDQAECRSRTQHLADDDYTRHTGADQGGVNQGAGYDALMRRHDARRGYESYYRQCLHRKGYRLIEQQPAPATKT